ncbi:ABC transporter permease [Blastococcus atacamensis]|uniref:ABC transporter permease n=1 Tax=Blastococcus atacamensis TaxID=2070508 RepID=UPI000CEBC13D|nr:ABC transporter permease [Blastococcus atacamensis]
MTTTTVRSARPSRLGRVEWKDYVVYAGFVVVFLFFAVTQPSSFLSVANLTNILVQAAPIMVLAVGLVFVLSAGEIDLSIGSVVALSALSAAVVLQSTGSWPLAVLTALGVGLGVGLLNGIFVAVVRLPSFLVTLATMGLVAGLARELTDLQSVPVTDGTFISLFGAKWLGLPATVWWAALVLVVGGVALRQTRYGAHVLAVGNNASAARVSGIKVARVRIAVLVGSAMAASVAGLLYSARLQGARYTLGEADLMTAIAAVIVGGTSLFGGKGTVVGAAVGSLLMAMLNNGLILAGLSVSQQMVARAVIILIAVSISLRGKRGS